MRQIYGAAVCMLMFLGFSAGQQTFPNACPGGATPHFPATAATPIDSQCGLQGAPPPTEPADGPQNEAKNNFCADLSAAKPIHLTQIASLEGSAEKDSHYTPEKPPTDRAFLKTLGEGNVVVFEGFVFEARQECGETVNCGAAVPNENASHDIHIALLEQPRKTKSTSPKPAQDKEECTGFVAEMIPHHRPDQWTACNVNATQGLKVRVTGQQFFDGSHVPCKGGAPQGSNPKRVSLWEIHPIYAFEVCPKGKGDCANGGWEPLEQFAAGKPACPEAKCQKKPPAKSGKSKGSGHSSSRKKSTSGV